jgi:hypothetical protein
MLRIIELRLHLFVIFVVVRVVLLCSQSVVQVSRGVVLEFSNLSLE